MPDSLDSASLGKRRSQVEETQLANAIEAAEAAMARELACSPEALAELAAIGRAIRDGKMQARDALRDGEGRSLPDQHGCARMEHVLWLAARHRRAGAHAGSAALAEELVRLRLHRRVLDRLAATVDPGSALGRRLRCEQRRADRCKAELVAANLHIAAVIARRYRRGTVDLADLVQEGSIGLLRACDKFDATRGHRFGTYAAFWVRQQILRAMVEHSSSIRVPLEIEAARQRVARVQRTFRAKNGREPTTLELTEASQLEPGLVTAVQELARASVSLSSDDKDRPGDLLATIRDERVTPPDQALDRERMKARMHQLLAQLNPREATILDLRFGLSGPSELTLREVGERFNLSRERVRRIEEKALKRLATMVSAGMSIV